MSTYSNQHYSIETRRKPSVELTLESAQLRRVVDGANLEKISDAEFRQSAGCVSAAYPTPIPSLDHRVQRLSIDGTNFATMPEVLSIGRAPDIRSVSPHLAPISAVESFSVSLGPQRSKFANFGRRAPGYLPRRQWRNERAVSESIIDDNSTTEKSAWRPISMPYEPIALQNPMNDDFWPPKSLFGSARTLPRPMPSHLPRLTIPENRRPPVEPIQTSWPKPTLGNHGPVQKINVFDAE